MSEKIQAGSTTEFDYNSFSTGWNNINQQVTLNRECTAGSNKIQNFWKPLIFLYNDSSSGLPGFKQGYLNCRKIFIDTGQPYIIGAWYFTAWTSHNSYHPVNALQVYGTLDPWGGVRQYANGQDPWGLYTFVSNPLALRDYYANRKPLLDYYELTDQQIMDNHIQQAANGGLSFFSFYYYWNIYTNQEMDLSLPIHNFISSPYKNKIKFMIAPISRPGMTLDQWQNSVVPYIVDNFISDSSYLTTVDGRAIINDFNWGFENDKAAHKQAVEILRNAVLQRTGKNPVILGEFGYLESEDSLLSDKYADPSDYDGYQCFHMQPLTHDDAYDNAISYWQRSAIFLDNYFHVPCATTGFDTRPWFKIGSGSVGQTTTPAENQVELSNMAFYTDITPETFGQQLLTLKTYLDQHPAQTGKMLTIYAWNEWGEGGIIEPSYTQNYQYLNIIKDTFQLIPH